MSKICPRYAKDKPKICPRYAQDMHKICPRYDQDMTRVIHHLQSNICLPVPRARLGHLDIPNPLALQPPTKQLPKYRAYPDFFDRWLDWKEFGNLEVGKYIFWRKRKTKGYRGERGRGKQICLWISMILITMVSELHSYCRHCDY